MKQIVLIIDRRILFCDMYDININIFLVCILSYLCHLIDHNDVHM